MSCIGTVESLWRYPVKSMRGEEVESLYVSYAGIYGDRLFAFVSSGARESFPWFTGRDKREMIRYRPRFRQADKAAHPSNYLAAQNNPPGANPLPAPAEELMVDVEMPDGRTFAIDDPKLVEALRDGLDPTPELTLFRSEKAMTDCRPVSIFAIQTVRRLEQESGIRVDKRRFRANIYVDLPGTTGFAEGELVGRSLRIGSHAVVSVVERDPRCMMVTLDPDTAEKTPVVLKKIAQEHNGDAGLYAAVLREGLVRKGDAVELLGNVAL